MKKALAAALAAALCMALTSCGYRLSIEKTTEEPVTETVPVIETLPPETVPVTTTEPATEADTPTLTVDSSYEIMAMPANEVIALYTCVMNDVKNMAPGYTKTETQQTYDVSAGSGNTQLANNILALVADSLLGGSDGSVNIFVSPGSIIQTREIFPLFGQTTGCALTDYGIVKSAVCYKNADSYKIVIQLNDTLNPDSSGDFAKIMTPADVSEIQAGIPTYLVVLNYDSYRFDMNYTGCEINCVIAKDTSRMISLSHKTVIRVDIDINLDLILFRTQSVKCSGTVVDHVDYSDFVW